MRVRDSVRGQQVLVTTSQAPKPEDKCIGHSDDSWSSRRHTGAATHPLKGRKVPAVVTVPLFVGTHLRATAHLSYCPRGRKLTRIYLESGGVEGDDVTNRRGVVVTGRRPRTRSSHAVSPGSCGSTDSSASASTCNRTHTRTTRACNTTTTSSTTGTRASTRMNTSTTTRTSTSTRTRTRTRTTTTTTTT